MAANDLGWVDAVALRDLLADGEVTPAGVAEGAMARIEAANPALNAVVVPLPDIGRAIAADPPLPRRAAGARSPGEAAGDTPPDTTSAAHCQLPLWSLLIGLKPDSGGMTGCVRSRSTSVEPALPVAVGPLSGAVLDVLSQRSLRRHLARIEAPVGDSDPYGLDLQLALYVCYELHYRGFAGVDPRWEWNPSLLHLRGLLEESFLSAVQREVGQIDPDNPATDVMEELSVEPVDGQGPSYYLRDAGTWQQMREYFVHRSLYHLKEGDPHAWVIPRLIGQAKASFVAVEFDEYGGGRGNHVHQQLYADLMDAAGLNSTYLGYLDYIGAQALASVNLMSMFGLHRELRGAAIGHFASTEITSSPGSRRLVEALERMGAPQACGDFYREHVEADAVHEQVVRTDVVGDLVQREAQLDRDVVFGIRARDVVEDRLANHLMGCWTAGRTSLRRTLS